jgi:hypothetical protein
MFTRLLIADQLYYASYIIWALMMLHIKDSGFLIIISIFFIQYKDSYIATASQDNNNLYIRKMPYIKQKYKVSVAK